MAQPSSFPRYFRVLWATELLTSVAVFLLVPAVAAQSSAPVPLAQPSGTFRSLDIPGSFQQIQPDSYVLGPGDILQLDVFRIPEYSGEFEVLVNGVLNLPMVGQVAVSGMTLEAATAAISRAYAQRLRRPIINLYLTTPRPLEVGIAGEVSHPGSYVLEREGTQFPTLIRALEAAGGVTQSADLRQVVIQRVRPDGSKQTLPTDLWQLLQTGDLRYNIALRDGDTIQVPPRESFNPHESLQLAAASFAADESQPLNIAVVGEVFRPGPYTVTGSARTGEAGVPGGSSGSNTPPTVTRAIQVAGGIKPEANIREVTVYRRTRDGGEQRIGINLWQLLAEGDITEDIVLQEGDTVFVPQAETLLPAEVAEIAAASFSPDTIRINVVGEVDRPGVVEVPPNTPLSQGILAAGGFDDRRASQGAVDLIRLNPDGTATRSSVAVDFSEGIDEDINPLLRNNDIIIVRRSTSASLADALDTIAVPLGRAFSLFTLPLSILNLFD
jgi:polysaccharide export outer membrane protein